MILQRYARRSEGIVWRKNVGTQLRVENALNNCYNILV